MNKKTGPDLIRQTLTRFWYYNMYLQKPYNSGYNFLFIFKLAYMVEIFLTNIRPARKKTYNLQIKHKIKKNTHRLTDIATYKLLNIKLLSQNKKINMYINIASRKEIYPHLNQTFQLKQIEILLKKKLKIFNYKQILKKKLFFTQFFQKTITTKKITTNTYNFKHNTKQKQLIQFLHLNRQLKNKKLQNKKFIFRFLIKNLRLKKNYKLEKKNKILFRKLNLRFLKKQNLNMKQWTYFFLFPTHHFKKLIQTKQYFNLLKLSKFTKNNKIKYIVPKLRPKFNFHKKNKKNYWFMQIKNKKLKFTHNTVSNLIFISKIKQQASLEQIEKIKNNWKFNLKMKTNINLMDFWYSQIFLQILDFKLINFLKIYTNNKYYQVTLKNEFAFPKTKNNLIILEKNLIKTTKFLKNTNKFYNNFINMLPSLQTFIRTQNLAKQIAAELGRTKKHWKVLKGIELLILQTFIQIQKAPINSQTNFKGLQIIINGRPNKISRTVRLIFKFGIITKSSFVQSNVTKSFASANAQIGSFGITVIAVT